MLDYSEAAASVAAALDDAERTLIGDPRAGVYKVSFITTVMKEAMQYARQLARLGIIPTTMITHDQFGHPILASVNIWSNADHAALLEVIKPKLGPARAEELEDLVVARGPIPDELLEKIWKSHKGGRASHQIASKMNELDVMPGRGGRGWTAKKVRDALAEFKRRREQLQETA
jgi:hypothetical protein